MTETNKENDVVQSIENNIVQSIENNIISHKTEVNSNQLDNDTDNLYNNNDANKSEVVTYVTNNECQNQKLEVNNNENLNQQNNDNNLIKNVNHSSIN